MINHHANKLCIDKYHGKEGKVAYGVYLDFQKASDTVNQAIAKVKLQNYGLGVFFNWFKSYLKGYKQFKVISNASSQILALKNEVFLGSLLRPILSQIYLNDLHDRLSYYR